MLPVRALSPSIVEPDGSLYHQHRQQRNRDSDDGIDIRGPGRLDRHGTASVGTSTAGRNPRHSPRLCQLRTPEIPTTARAPAERTDRTPLP